MNTSKTKRIALIGASILTAVLCAGCEVGFNVSSKPAGPRHAETPTEDCIKGVVYYRMGHGLAAAFTPDSRVVTCEAHNAPN